VKKLNVLAVTVALLFAPVAFAGGVSEGMQNLNHVQGEKLDSGLGELGPSYTGAEFMGAALLGEKLDSGLGELTQEEIDRVVAAARQTMTASNSR
jgi:hypothetical protein